MKVNSGQVIRERIMKNSTIKLNTLLYTLLFLIIVCAVLLNAVLILLSGRHLLSIDLTANTRYMVGADTRRVLSSLSEDVQIYVLASREQFSGTPYLIQARQIIEQYSRYSVHAHLRYIDYAADPAFAARYPDLDLNQGDIIVTNGNLIRHLTLTSLFNYSAISADSVAVVSSRAEEAMTSAIIYVSGEEPLRIANLIGSGGAELSAWRDLLSDNSFEVIDINPGTGILDDSYDIAMLLSPRFDFSEDMLIKLDAFLNNDGKYGKLLLYTVDPGQPELPYLEAFLSEWGIEIGDGAVFETKAENTYQMQPFFIVAEYTDQHFNSLLLDNNMPIAILAARPLTVRFEMLDNRFVQTLLSFSSSSAVRPSDAGEDFNPQMAIERGPFPALILASNRVRNEYATLESHIIVSSSTAILDDFSLHNTSLANSEYMLNLFSELSGRTDYVSIPPKSLAGDILAVPTTDTRVLGTLLLGIVPVGILLVGVSRWLFRRYQ